MENVLTVTAFSQVLLSVWIMDWIASLPGLVFGAIVFGLLVASVRQALDDAQPASKPDSTVRKAPRVLGR